MKKFYNSQYLHIPLFFFPLTFILGIAVAEIFALFFLLFLVFNFKRGKNFFERKIIILTLFSVYIAFNAMFQITDDLKYSSFFHLRYLLFSFALFLFFEKSLSKNCNEKIFHIFLFAIALFLIFFFLTILFIKELRNLFIRSFIIFLVFAASIIFFDYGKSNVTYRVFNKTYHQIFQDEKADTLKKVIVDKSRYSKIKIFSTDHQGHLILAKKLFLDNLVFGVGPKGFRHYCRKINYDSEVGICSTHPHNILAQIASELGIIGIIFFLIFFIFLIKRFFDANFVKTKNNHHYAFLVASLGIFINLFPFLPSGNLFNNWISLFIYFNLGLYLVSNKKINFK